MKIAQIAPLAQSVPPQLYGGTERVVSYLTEELVSLGHAVTRFASGASETWARLAAGAHQFDVLHFHTDHLHLPCFRAFSQKTVTTLHGRVDLPELQPLYREFGEMPLVSITQAQRRAMPHANWLGTVYHGLSAHACPFNPSPQGDYVVFIGRVSRDPELERASEIARRANVRLRIADFGDDLTEEKKPALLGNARALLFPSDWPAPFGLAMIEAMSCGTPVIAWTHGSAAELVDDGVTGRIVRSVDEAVAAIANIDELDREQVRLRFEERFSAARMARDYLALYRKLARQRAARVA